MKEPFAYGRGPGESHWSLHHGSVLDVVREYPENHFDAVLCDDPYGLGTREPTAEEIAAYVLGRAAVDMGGDFMGKDWTIPSVTEWREILRVLKPGSPMLAFAGSRTQDLVTIGIRAAGFEIGDSVHWYYTQSMPKPASTTDVYIDLYFGVEREVVGERMLTGNAAVDTKTKGGTLGIQVGTVPPKKVPITAATTELAKRWEGYGQTLKPAYEPATLAWKPFEGTIAANIEKWDVGALNIRECRAGLAGGTKKLIDPDQVTKAGNALKGSVDGSLNRWGTIPTGTGRWPANVLATHDERCVPKGTKLVRSGTAVKHNGVSVDTPSWGGTSLGAYPEGTPDAGYAGPDGLEETDAWDCHPDCPVAIIDRQSGERPSTLTGRADAGERHDNPGDNGGKSMFGGGNSAVYADDGTAAKCFVKCNWSELDAADRIFFASKVARLEREFGCEHLPLKSAAECTDRPEGSVGTDRPQSGAGRGSGARNHGPCLKPIALTTYQARLLRPPPRPDGKPRRILIPWAGTGSEAIGALRAGWDEVVMIERDEQYIPIAVARLTAWSRIPLDADPNEMLRSARGARVDPRQTTLFEVK